MTHGEKVAHFEACLRERGLWKANAMPPAFRLLWKLGVEVWSRQRELLDLPRWRDYPR